MGLTILINAVFRKNSNFSLEAKEMAGNWKTRKINWETRNNIKISIPHIACNFSCKKETNGGKIYTNSYFHKWENVQNFQGDLHHYSTWYSIIALVTPRLIRFFKKTQKKQSKLTEKAIQKQDYMTVEKLVLPTFKKTKNRGSLFRFFLRHRAESYTGLRSYRFLPSRYLHVITLFQN